MKDFEDLVNQIADQERVPRDVAQAIVDNENQDRDPLEMGDRSRAYGLMQIWLRTAQDVGFRGAGPELLNPTVNLRFGLRYLRKMYDQVGEGDWSRAAAAYNAGPDLSPWPEHYVSSFEINRAEWRRSRPTPPPPPVLAGASWGLVLAVLGWVLPMLFKKRRRAHA